VVLAALKATPVLGGDSQSPEVPPAVPIQTLNHMNHGNSTRYRRLCLWLCALALGCGGVLSVMADQVLTANSYDVLVVNDTTETHNYGLRYWLGPAPEPVDPGELGPVSVPPGGNHLFTVNVSTVGGFDSDPNIFPNLLQMMVLRDGEEVPITAVPYRITESGTVYVSDFESGSTTWTDGADPEPTEGGMTLPEFQTTQTESMASTVMGQYALRPTQGEITDEAAAQGSAMAEALDAVHAPGVGTASVSTEKSILHFELPGHDGTLSIDPMDFPVIAQVQPWMKSAITWSILLTYAWFLWVNFFGLMRDAGQSQQAKGNALVGGTGAQATALIAAIAMGLLIIAIPASWWALTTVDLNPLSSNPFTPNSGIIGTTLYIVGLLVPYDLVLVLITSSFVMIQGKTVILAVYQATVRAIVP